MSHWTFFAQFLPRLSVLSAECDPRYDLLHVLEEKSGNGL